MTNQTVAGLFLSLPLVAFMEWLTDEMELRWMQTDIAAEGFQHRWLCAA